MPSIAAELHRRLEAALSPTRLEVVDESHRHAGHAGSRPRGETHFAVTVVAAAFAARTRLARQRLVYAAAGDLMATDIHALSITARAPGEPAG